MTAGNAVAATNVGGAVRHGSCINFCAALLCLLRAFCCLPTLLPHLCHRVNAAGR